ncbi:MAG: acyltransferase [Bacteroidales bacterium]|nr:acyltransferase [Bacteroidales bacterium]
MTFSEKIFSISSEQEFNNIALEMFDFQMQKNSLYADFVNKLRSFRGSQQPMAETFDATFRPEHFTEIPCLPVEFFKNHNILIDGENTDQYFASSGTTGINTSKHFIADFNLYEKSFTKGFTYFWDSPENYVILALLPNYSEQQNSSLIYMMDSLIKQTQSPESGFFLDDLDELNSRIQQLKHKKIILFGVSYALLDFAEQYPQTLENTMVFETGGMKGRREELSKTELHKRLCEGFGVEKIYSEYGMTELLSQAYSKGENLFSCPPWMRVFTRPLTNPSGVEKHHVAGGINVIDLANYKSCPFIATQDLGKTFPDSTFEVLGRIEGSDVRGCSLLTE